MNTAMHSPSLSSNADVMQTLNPIQDTYGEKPLLIAEWDNESTAKYSILMASVTASVLCPLVGCVGLCCYPACLKSAQSRKLTLGERSLFYAGDTYCCCGPCMCKCNSTEKQVPLDKLQDLTLSQNCIARVFDVWTMKMETAGQAGPEAGPELSLAGMKNPRDFKQVVLERRNMVTENGAGSCTPAPPGMAGADATSVLLRIEQRLVDIEAGCRGNKYGAADQQ
eukprot:TRINITY_DN25401_c0_g1_i1.p1 TRINITY_DN25401_c0_g1~~TRINITY_DN25401_c0_g1_i1.p1  ORF type:complete len:224 (-),score=38.32 TRINITY_DN25401_c0_g1_i1:285-956(-)